MSLGTAVANEAGNPSLAAPGAEILALAAVARQAADLGRLEDARTLLEGLVLLEPGSAYLQTCLGCVFMRLDCNTEALECFDTALACDPRDVAAHTFAGELRLDAGQVEAAARHFDTAVSLDPQGRNAHANRARTLRLLAAAKPPQPAGGGKRA